MQSFSILYHSPVCPFSFSLCAFSLTSPSFFSFPCTSAISSALINPICFLVGLSANSRDARSRKYRHTHTCACAHTQTDASVCKNVTLCLFADLVNLAGLDFHMSIGWWATLPRRQDGAVFSSFPAQFIFSICPINLKAPSKRSSTLNWHPSKSWEFFLLSFAAPFCKSSWWLLQTVKACANYFQE